MSKDFERKGIKASEVESSGQFINFSITMKSVFLLALAFGCTLAAQPYVWSNDTCPEEYDSIEPYIIQGENAPEGQYPYMLSMSSEATNKHTCGASILTSKWALTAAHCCAVLSSNKHYLKSGTNSLTSGGNKHRMETYIVHENYMPNSNWKNDICLIKVSDPFVYGPKVQQVTLPPQSWNINDGDLVTITGWGYTKPDVKVCPDKLQLGKNFVYYSPTKCGSLTGMIHESYLCAIGGSKGQGVCNGDSGSPLVKNGVQIGVASWVYLPCGCGKPDFYSRVPLFINWIKQKLGADATQLKFLN